MLRARQVAFAASISVVTLLTGMGTAAADPQKNTPVTIACGSTTYLASVNGNGEFTPAHDLASTSVLVPTSFGETTGVLTDATGTVIATFTDPPSIKGSSGKARTTSVSCSFGFSETFEDPDLGTLTFTVEGTVNGFVTPLR